jgi:hypothetical protein
MCLGLCVRACKGVYMYSLQTNFLDKNLAVIELRSSLSVFLAYKRVTLQQIILWLRLWKEDRIWDLLSGFLHGTFAQTDVHDNLALFKGLALYATENNNNNYYYYYFLWRNSPTMAKTTSLLRFLDRPHHVGLLWRSDQPVADAATYTTHSKHKRRTPMPPAPFELVIPATGGFRPTP